MENLVLCVNLCVLSEKLIQACCSEVIINMKENNINNNTFYALDEFMSVLSF